jgi:hypothetical protein
MMYHAKDRPRNLVFIDNAAPNGKDAAGSESQAVNRGIDVINDNRWTQPDSFQTTG